MPKLAMQLGTPLHVLQNIEVCVKDNEGPTPGIPSQNQIKEQYRAFAEIWKGLQMLPMPFHAHTCG